MTSPIITPGPGIYRGIPAAEYHAWDAASNSRLSRLQQSPAHLKAYLDNPSKDTKALRVGRAVHTAVLEPHEFHTTFTVADRCSAIKKSDSLQCTNPGILFHDQLGWLCGQHLKGVPAGYEESRMILPLADYATCLKVHDAIRLHSAANSMLSGAGDNELSVVWNDPETGLLCKARFDRHSPAIAGGVIADIKTTVDASRREFERSIFSRGYHRQGAFYLDGATESGLEASHFVHIAAEKEEPCAIAVYRLTEGAIDAGRDQLRRLKRQYAACLESGEWPGYSADVQDVSLPDYAWRQIEEEVANDNLANQEAFA